MISNTAIEGVKAQSEVNAVGLLTGYTMKESDLKYWMPTNDNFNPISFVVRRLADLAEDPNKT
jgi:hypothetical protein